MVTDSLKLPLSGSKSNDGVSNEGTLSLRVQIYPRYPSHVGCMLFPITHDTNYRTLLQTAHYDNGHTTKIYTSANVT